MFKNLMLHRFCEKMYLILFFPDFNLKYLQENGLQYPILFKDKTGLGLR